MENYNGPVMATIDGNDGSYFVTVNVETWTLPATFPQELKSWITGGVCLSWDELCLLELSSTQENILRKLDFLIFYPKWQALASVANKRKADYDRRFMAQWYRLIA